MTGRGPRNVLLSTAELQQPRHISLPAALETSRKKKKTITFTDTIVQTY